MERELAVKEAEHLGFKFVYEGGHHVVFCNGELHVTSPKTPQDKILFNNSRLSKCNCHKFKKE